MIGHQQAGINALKSTLQDGDQPQAAPTQENGKEMEEVSEPPKVNNPALEEGTTTGGSGDAENPAATVENGTNNGAAAEKDNEEEEGEAPIDMSFPAKDGWKAILVYIISFPIMGPLYITLPDTKNEKSKCTLFQRLY